jgi:hypothetical protein
MSNFSFSLTYLLTHSRYFPPLISSSESDSKKHEKKVNPNELSEDMGEEEKTALLTKTLETLENISSPEDDKQPLSEPSVIHLQTLFDYNKNSRQLVVRVALIGWEGALVSI